MPSTIVAEIAVITTDGTDAVASLRTDAHSTPVLIVESGHGPLMGLPVAHVSPAILATLFDPGTTSTILDLIGA